jgi:hypothetical protein
MNSSHAIGHCGDLLKPNHRTKTRQTRAFAHLLLAAPRRLTTIPRDMAIIVLD